MNEYLITHCGLVTSSADSPVALMVSSRIDFRRSISYPEPVLAGLSIKKLGTSSVVYKVGVWAAQEGSRQGPREWQGLVPITEEAFCEGELTHVFVTPKERRPTPIPSQTRSKLEGLLLESAAKL